MIKHALRNLKFPQATGAGYLRLYGSVQDFIRLVYLGTRTYGSQVLKSACQKFRGETGFR